MSCTTVPSVGESHCESGVIPARAVPAGALPVTFTPAFLSAFWNAWAANFAGEACQNGRYLPVRPWLNDSAESGPTSLVRRRPAEGGPRKPPKGDRPPL